MAGQVAGPATGLTTGAGAARKTRQRAGTAAKRLQARLARLPRPDNRLRKTARQALRTGLACFVPVIAAALFFHQDGNAFFNPAQGHAPLSGPLAFLAALGFAMGAGTLLTLFRANRAPLRAVLRPTRGRMIGAVALALLVPIQIVSLIPFSPLGLMILSGGAAQGLSTGLTAFLIALVVLYPIAALIVSGVRPRWLRVVVFGQVWIAAYCEVLLVLGYIAIPA